MVPGFPAAFLAWRSALGRWRENRTGQRRRGCSYMFADTDPIHGLAQRVPLPAGALLLWNQMTVRCEVSKNT